MGTDTDINTLCLVWNSVFDLCLLLGPTGAEILPEFTAETGRKGWTVEKVVNEVWVPLGFSLVSPLDTSDPLYTDRLSVSLTLKGDCPSGCSLIPDDIEDGMNSSESTLTIVLDRYAIHLRGKGGVTHEAECHAGEGPIGVTTDLVITRPLTP